MPTYLSDAQYARLLSTVSRAEVCPFAGKVTVDTLMIAIGEHANVWPESIRADVIRDRMQNAVLR